jgi:hypothetical protein
MEPEPEPEPELPQRNAETVWTNAEPEFNTFKAPKIDSKEPILPGFVAEAAFLNF